jgi:hypothetical protein
MSIFVPFWQIQPVLSSHKQKCHSAAICPGLPMASPGPASRKLALFFKIDSVDKPLDLLITTYDLLFPVSYTSSAF